MEVYVTAKCQGKYNQSKFDVCMLLTEIFENVPPPKKKNNNNKSSTIALKADILEYYGTLSKWKER